MRVLVSTLFLMWLLFLGTSLLSSVEEVAAESSPRDAGAMSPLPSSPSARAAVLIHDVVGECGRSPQRPHDLATDVENRAREDGLGEEVRPYIAELRRWSHDVTIDVLPKGVGGVFDGSITVGVQTADVDARGLDWTVLTMQETYNHEFYHATHAHLQPMQTIDNTGGEIIVGEGIEAPIEAEKTGTVLIAGEGFEVRDVIEALTVAETGEQTVSRQYQENRRHVFDCLRHAGLGIGDMREAVNVEHDLTPLDDRRPSYEGNIILAP